MTGDSFEIGKKKKKKLRNRPNNYFSKDKIVFLRGWELKTIWKMVFHCSYSFHTFYWINTLCFSTCNKLWSISEKLEWLPLLILTSLICMPLGDGFLEFLNTFCSIVFFLFFSWCLRSPEDFFCRLIIPNH